MKLKLIFAALLACAAPMKSYDIEGTVVDVLTGAALDRVQVSIAPTSDRARPSYATTGSNGRFRFQNVPAGKWSLSAKRRGYLLQHFGQTPSLSNPGVAIVTGPGESGGHLLFRLYPPAMITGKVTDSAGEPVENASVQVLSWTIAGGRRRVWPVRSGWTNDDGMYAVGSLPAGTYFVAVTAKPWYEERLDQRGLAAGFRAQFYPGVADPRLATAIPLRPGEEITADFTLTAEPAVTLTINTSKTPGRLQLTSQGIQGAPVFYRGSDSESTVHTFHLVPGSYTALLWSDSEQPAAQTIELPASDTVVQFTPDADAKVDAVVEVPEIAASAPGSLGFVLIAEDGSRSFPRMLPPNGNVMFPQVAPGRYRLMLIGPAARKAYIDRVTVEGARFAKGILEFAGGATVRLGVIVGAQRGRVAGKVYRAGHPLPGVSVILAPRTDTGNPYDYRLFVSDSDGSFEYETLKPGDYVIFAVENASELEYANPSAVAAYMEAGRQLRVERDTTLDLRLELPAAEAQTRR